MELRSVANAANVKTRSPGFIAHEEYFATIQSRVGELKTQGLSADEIVERLTSELAPRLSDWQENGTAIIDTTVRTAFDEAP